MKDSEVIAAINAVRTLKTDDESYNRGLEDAAEAVARHLSLYKYYEQEKRLLNAETIKLSGN